MIKKNGRPSYGEAIGIIILDTTLLRIPGDVGNATTFDFPIRYIIAKGVDGPAVVNKNPDPKIRSIFVEAAKELERSGVRAIACGCGFIGRFQKDLTNAVNIPVFSSSLLLVPLVSRTLAKDKKVGIILDDGFSEVTKELLEAVGIDISIPIAIAGLDWLKSEEKWSDELDSQKRLKKLEKNFTQVAKMLISKNPDVGAIVLECTNLPPAASAIQEETGLPVYDITTLINLAFNSVVRKKFTGYI